ncbi:MAG: sigma-54-dependent transcriptional regulator [Gemmatimonadota bacterium]
MSERILIVDDERLTRETLAAQLADEGFEVITSESAFEGLEHLQEQEIDLVLTDLRMPSMDGIEFQKKVAMRWPEIPLVFMTAFGTVSTAVEAMRAGAADYLTKPLNTEELLIRVRRLLQHKRDLDEIRRLRIDAARRRKFGELIYRSPVMTSVVERALSVADTDVSVLVQGETGTGKEVLSRAIHAHSQHAGGPFVAVNCAGLNPNLVESELFGHEAGAFTGANRRRKGRIETAHGGTLFIDEVDDLPMDLQVRLLRVLQDGTFERVGSSTTLEADIRVICATKKDLGVRVEEGTFRQDLYYRINTVQIDIPPLRERREDILPLVEFFVRRGCEGAGVESPPVMSEEALKLLLAHPWPGNVRELQHAVDHALALCRTGEIRPEHLPETLRMREHLPVVALNLAGREAVPLHDALKSAERRLIEWALEQAGGNQVRAAEILSVPRTTLRSRIQALRGEGTPARTDKAAHGYGSSGDAASAGDSPPSRS